MFKFDENDSGDRFIITPTLRKVMMDLSNESNYSGNETDVDSLPSIQIPYTFRKRKKY